MGLFTAQWAKQVCWELLSWTETVYTVEGNLGEGKGILQKVLDVNVPSFGLASAHVFPLPQGPPPTPLL